MYEPELDLMHRAWWGMAKIDSFGDSSFFAGCIPPTQTPRMRQQLQSITDFRVDYHHPSQRGSV